jgi:hypothetical protein
MATCQQGFSVLLVTDKGKFAGPLPLGCSGGGFSNSDETSESELRNFVHVQPEETRSWQTTISTKGIPRGTYCLFAQHLSNDHWIGDVGLLPLVHGLMGKGQIPAQPFSIHIR